MVTGSHIPFDRNGLKFYRPDGEITKADEAAIAGAFGATAGAPISGALRTAHRVGERYVERYADFFGAGCLGGLRVGVWEHSAAGRDLTCAALRALGAEVVRLGRTDSFAPIDTEAVAEADAARIAGWVFEHRLVALVSTDGDGDRPLIADETGAVLRGDAVGILTAHRLDADAVAAPLNVSTALERSGWFSQILRTRIGSPFVIAALDTLRGEAAAPGRLRGQRRVSPRRNRHEPQRPASRQPSHARRAAADRHAPRRGGGRSTTPLRPRRPPARPANRQRPAAGGARGHGRGAHSRACRQRGSTVDLPVGARSRATAPPISATACG